MFDKLYGYFSLSGKSLYVQRLCEKLEESTEEGTATKKCIRVTEREVNEHKILTSLYDTLKQKDVKVFHFDITSSVSYLLLQLFI